MTHIFMRDGDRDFMLRYPDPSDLNPCLTNGYNLGRPAVRAVVEDASGQSGVYDLTTEFGARTITMQTKFLDTPDGVSKWAHLDEFLTYTHPESRPYLHVQQDGWEQERRIFIRTEDVSYDVARENSSYLDVALSFNAPRGAFEAADAQSKIVVASGGNTMGRTYPRSYPLFYPVGAGGAGTDSITNVGSISTKPILWVFGYAKNPVIKNLSTGQTMKFNVEIPSGSYLEINVAARTVYMNGDNRLDYWGSQDFSISTVPYFRLRRGENVMSMTASTTGPSSQLQVIYRPRFI